MSNRPEDHRRKWDRAEYEKIAADRIRAEREAEDEPATRERIRRELLRHREEKVNLEANIGKSVVITKTTPSSQGPGYYCEVCDCVVKDSINYLDHINGKKHQRNLGMSMKVERSTLDQVKQRFEMNKRKLQEKKKDYDLTTRVEEIKEEEEKLREYRREKRKEKKRKHEEVDDLDGNDEMAAIMGFGGFGSSKAKK